MLKQGKIQVRRITPKVEKVSTFDGAFFGREIFDRTCQLQDQGLGKCEVGVKSVLIEN